MPPQLLRVFSSSVCAYVKAGDKVGKLLGWCSMLPFLSVFFVAVHVYTRRELRSVFVLAGLVVNQMMCMVAKETIRQPRPSTCEDLHDCDSWGMPSNHSQTIAFSAAIFIGIVASRPGRGLQLVVQLANALGLVAASLAVAWSRVYLGYHTPMQVVAGLAAGTVLGAIWSRLLAATSPYFPRIEAWPACLLLQLRDSSHLVDPLAAERTAAAASRSQARKSS